MRRVDGRQRRRRPVGIPVAHLPIGYQAGATQPASFDPSATAGSPIDALLREMNAYLDSLGATTRVVAPPAVGTPPDVMFGCSDAAGMDCTEPDDVSSPQMRLAVARPSGEWTAWLQQPLASAGVEHILLVTLETAEYWSRQRNLLGQKEVRLAERRGRHRHDLRRGRRARPHRAPGPSRPPARLAGRTAQPRRRRLVP